MAHTVVVVAAAAATRFLFPIYCLHDTFGRVFACLDPDAFGQCFQSWTQEMHRATGGQVIAAKRRKATPSLSSSL